MKEYPLTWPRHWPRTKSPKSSQFKTSLSKSLGNVTESLRRFSKDSGKNVTDIVISSNVTLGQQKPEDCGVAVYFKWDGLSTCIAVDIYNKLEDNLQAIYHCIEAERTKLRHGGLNIVRASFQGYAALPAPSSGRDPYEVLGVKRSDSTEEIQKAYKEKVKSCHPDKTGIPTPQIAEVNAAWDSIKKERAA